MRVHDAIARALLAELLRLEAQPWPQGRPAYAAALSALATRCETEPAAVAECYLWLRFSLRRPLRAPGAARRTAREDALAMIAARMAELLHRFRVGLDRTGRPNVRSMLRFRVQADARTILSREVRHRELRAAWRAWCRASGRGHPTVVPRLGVLAGLVGAGLRSGDAAAQAWLLVAAGYTVSEAAREAGVSRACLYERRRALRARWTERDGPADATYG